MTRKFIKAVVIFSLILGISPYVYGQDKNDPAVWHDEGIYFYNKKSSGNALVSIDASVSSETKRGGYGQHAANYWSGGLASTKTDAILSGAHSQTVVKDKKTVFYCYFKADDINPKLFSLCRFIEKKHDRVLVMGSSNAYGFSSGISPKQIVEFSYEKLSAGIFKIVPKEDLDEGEYCFVYIGKNESPFANGFYDFGVSPE